MASTIIGFDLGSRNTVIAVAQKGGVDILLNEMVAFGEKERSIGESALTNRMRNLTNTVDGAHLLLGLSFDSPEAQREMKRHFCKFLKLENGDIGVEVTYAFEKRTFTIEQIVGMQLQKMKEIAEKAQGASVRDVVISCPVFFTSRQRQALLDAAVIAGLNPLRIINEQTASAISWGIYKREVPEVEELAMKTMIIDVGQATTSAAVFALWKGHMKCLGATYDSNLGGRDVDQILADHYAIEFGTKYKLNVASSQRAQARLLDAAERLKKVLNSTPEGVMNIDSFMDDIDVTGRMTRDEFEKRLNESGYLERSVAPVKQLLEQTGLKAAELSSIEICGSGSRLLALQRAFETLLGREVSKTINTEESVARGAALQCAILSPLFKVRDFEILDGMTYPIGAKYLDSTSNQEISEPMELFSKSEVFPKVKKIVQLASAPFEVRCSYTDGVLADVATFKIPKIPAGDKVKLELRIKVDIHGILRLESVVHKEVVEEPATPPPQSPAGADPDKPQDEAAAAAAAAAAAPKKKIVRNNVDFVPVVAGLAKGVRDSFVEEEGKMVASDRLSVETGEARNALETYVYDMRDKIIASLATFAKPQEVDQLKGMLQTEEDWLYTDEGTDSTKSVFVDRLKTLRAISDPIELRKREAESRPEAIRSLRAALETFGNFVTSEDPKWEHIGKEERQTVKERLTSTEQWLQSEVAKQESMAPNADPVLTTALLQTKKVALEQYVNPIMNKRKPAPPKEEPKKEEPKKEEPKPEEAAGTPPPAKDDMEVD